MDERGAFLAALAANEDDVTTRMVYADWLDERGEHEEADRQRKWPAAKAWLVRFAKKYSPDPGDSYEEPISYEMLIRVGHEGLAEGEIIGGYSLCDALDAAGRDFWRNWSIVTGVPGPAPTADRRYGCSC